MILPQIVVKIQDGVPLNLDQGTSIDLGQLANLAGVFGFQPIVEFIQQLLPDLRLSRVFDTVSPAQLAALVADAQSLDPSYAPPRFENYLKVVCPPGFDVQPLVAALNQWAGVVEFAYFVPPSENAQIVGTTNPFFAQQDYLKPGPMGIGVQAAWTQGASGSGMRVIDIEHAWFLGGHEDLPPNLALQAGVNGTVDQGHGTAVVGVIAAIDNGVGVIGIAPRVSIDLLSVFDADPSLTETVELTASRIVDALLLSIPGDVILLEISFGGAPVELADDLWHAIRLATASRRIVVEAAGNGGHDLDQIPNVRGRRILATGTPEFDDSGAILVGSCESFFTHRKMPGSCFGSRIDCHAWGENILTTGAGPGLQVSTNSYFNFSGTSAASAIIAGVCALVQELPPVLIGLGAGRFLPRRLRNILRNPENGAESIDSDQIRFMPDLAKIIANEFL